MMTRNKTMATKTRTNKWTIMTIMTIMMMMMMMMESVNADGRKGRRKYRRRVAGDDLDEIMTMLMYGVDDENNDDDAR